MLIGLSAALLPLVVHLLSRARYRSVDWGAMMFLDGADPNQQQSSRVSQWLLMAVRMALIAAVAVALARPMLPGSFAAPGSGQQVTAVILLDCSASMSYDENGHPRMVLARGAAKKVLALHKGDRAALHLMGRDQTPADRATSADLWEIGKRIEAAEPAYGKADVAASLLAAAEALASESSLPANGNGVDGKPSRFANVYVICDRQASNWEPLTDAFRATWEARLRRAGIAARLFLVPVGGSDGDNVAVESITLLDAPAIVNQPAEIEVKVRNYGPVQWAALPLTVSVDKRPPVFDQKVSLPPNGAATFRVSLKDSHVFREPGTHVITAAVQTTGFTADDRHEIVVDVVEPIRVLVISGDEQAGPMVDGKVGGLAGESDYLHLALTPHKLLAKRDGADSFAVDVALPENWSGQSVGLGRRAERNAAREPREARLSDFQVVVLANLERFTARQVTALEQYVYDGGGVLVAPGNLSRAEEYNAALYRGGQGILPAALHPPTAVDGSQETSLSGFDPQHPALGFLRGRPDAFLSAVVGRYFPTAPHGASARDVIRYTSGHPFLIESAGRAFAKGRVLLMTTSLDGDWSTLPLSGFYLPFVQSAVRYLADTSTRRTNLAPGDPIEVALEPFGSVRSVMVATPADPQLRSAELRGGVQAVARFTDTLIPGQYVVRINADGRRQQTIHYVVHAPAAESNLAMLTAQQWQKIGQSVDARMLDTEEVAISAADVAPPGSVDLLPWAIGLVMGLAVVELALARRWSSPVDEDEPDAQGVRA